MRASTHKNVRRLAASSIGLLALGLQANTAVGTALATPNTSTAAIAPISVANSSTANYAFTLTNTSGFTGSVLPLGSAQVVLPAGWGQPSFGALPSGWTVASNGAGKWCVSSASGLPAGQSVTFNYSELAQSTAGSATFTTTAFIGQNCSLTLGTIPYDGSQPTVSVDTLVYTAHSTSGVVNMPITPGYTVTATKSDGTTDTSFTEPIQLTLGANPGGATNFHLSQTPSNGSTTFTPTISKVGDGYTVLASSDGSPGVASADIFVTPAASSVPCPAGQSCDTGVVTNNANKVTAAEVIGETGPQYDVVSVAVGVADISCAGTQTSPAPLSVFFGDFNRNMTVKLLYDRDKDSDPFNGFTVALSPTSRYWKPVCYEDPTTPAPISLPACANNGHVRPCIDSEKIEPGDTNDILATVLSNPGNDPILRGP